MKDFKYLIDNFFTHKDFLCDPRLIPGTLWTPLHIAFEIFLVAFVILAARYVSKRKHIIRKVFASVWFVFAVWEVVIIAWDSLASMNRHFDASTNLSLYPCSIFLYAVPFLLWGNEITKKMACGYICTLGFLGAAINIIYPATRLMDYSCISFVGFHTTFYHGAMLFVYLVIMMSGFHNYGGAESWKDLFLPSVPGLIVSIPANIINYSPINADYMFFKGQFPLLSKAFPNVPSIVFTIVIYALYVIVPASFYLPSYLSYLRRTKKAEAVLEKEGAEAAIIRQ